MLHIFINQCLLSVTVWFDDKLAVAPINSSLKNKTKIVTATCRCIRSSF
jgi:hypothetical protein